MYFKNLLNKINRKKSVIAIIGLGYVGLPLAINYSLKGFKVIGIDNDSKKINKLNKGISYIKQFKSELIKKIQDKGFKAYSDFKILSKTDIIIFCLPTPLKKNKSPEMKYIKKSLENASKFFIKGQLLSLESTTYPGTTEEYFLPYLKNFKVGKEIFLCYSPEREDPGNKKFNLTKVPKIVAGYSKNCKTLANSIYSKLNNNQIVTVSDLKTAEMTKLLENIYRSINIGLVNELKILCEKMDIDIFEVINAAKTKPFGFNAFYPGPGLGGHCIPIDPFILSWKAKQFNFDTKFINLSGEINSLMPSYVFSRVKEIFNLKKLVLINSKLLIIGIAYKKNVDDLRESPALEIMNIFSKKNIKFDYHDDYIKKIPKTRKYLFNKRSVNLNPKNLKKYDAVLIVTDHDYIDYQKLKHNSKLLIDCRGRFKKIKNKIFAA